MTKTTETTAAVHVGDQVRAIAVELLREHPAGLDTSELNALVLAVAPTIPKPTIRHHVWKLDQRDPATFRAVGNAGAVALVKGA